MILSGRYVVATIQGGRKTFPSAAVEILQNIPYCTGFRPGFVTAAGIKIVPCRPSPAIRWQAHWRLCAYHIVILVRDGAKESVAQRRWAAPAWPAPGLLWQAKYNLVETFGSSGLRATTVTRSASRSLACNGLFNRRATVQAVHHLPHVLFAEPAGYPSPARLARSSPTTCP